MAKVRNIDQPVRRQILAPTPVYSRIVSCSHYDPSPPGQDYAYTEQLAQRLRLLSVDIWLDTHPPFAAHAFTFSVWRMTEIPTSLLDMYTKENVLPVLFTVGGGYWHAYGPERHFHWSMNKLYEGVSQRFGVALTGVGAIIAQIHASFEISEG